MKSQLLRSHLSSHKVCRAPPITTTIVRINSQLLSSILSHSHGRACQGTNTVVRFTSQLRWCVSSRKKGRTCQSHNYGHAFKVSTTASRVKSHPTVVRNYGRARQVATTVVRVLPKTAAVVSLESQLQQHSRRFQGTPMAVRVKPQQRSRVSIQNYGCTSQVAVTVDRLESQPWPFVSIHNHTTIVRIKSHLRSCGSETTTVARRAYQVPATVVRLKSTPYRGAPRVTNNARASRFTNTVRSCVSTRHCRRARQVVAKVVRVSSHNYGRASRATSAVVRLKS